jgi:hypothetical protein
MQGGDMARPLTKHTRNGDRYARPTDIEAVIDAVLTLEWPELIHRSVVSDQNSIGYLPSECLVHLIRKAHQDDNEIIRDQLLSILLRLQLCRHCCGDFYTLLCVVSRSRPLSRQRI